MEGIIVGPINMKKNTIISAAVLLAAVIGLSLASVWWWGGKAEEHSAAESQIVIASDSAPIIDISRLNAIPLPVILKALQIDSARAETTSLIDLQVASDIAAKNIRKALVIYNEHQSKNWLKIFLKFLFWFLLLPIPILLIAKRRMNPTRRRLLYLISICTFGIILGADPSPMGTVKDAIFLITSQQTIFWPRIFALVIFLLMVVAATKLICSWGCQFGTLQDVLFRFGRDRRDRKGAIKQYKPAFWISNSVRIAVFVLSVVFGLMWSLDIVGLVDPFKIYHPGILTAIGITALVIILSAALFVYRPWCHFACPFGLVSWFFEKLAIFRIRVDYNKCDACQVCNSACPSTVMDAILKQDKVIPDCFGCGVCVESCPTQAVSLTASRKPAGDYTLAMANLRAKREKLRNNNPA